MNCFVNIIVAIELSDTQKHAFGIFEAVDRLEILKCVRKNFVSEILNFGIQSAETLLTPG